VKLKLRPFREAFIGYHYVGVAVVVAVYGGVVYGAAGPQLLGRLDKGTRVTLYLSLASTNAVMLGFAITAVAIFLTLGPGKGLDLLSTTSDFPYVRKVLMGAIGGYAIATVVTTALIVADASRHGRRLLETAAAGVLALALLRTLSLLWLLNRLLRLAITDAQQRKP